MHIVLFDMDHTLIGVDTIDEWVKFMHNHGYIDKQQLEKTQQFNIDYQNGVLNIDDSYSFITGLIKSLARQISLEKLISLRQIFFEKCLKSHISDQALHLLKEYQQDPNCITVLITATVDFIAQPVFDFIPSLHHLIATTTNVHDEDVSQAIYGQPTIGVGKLEQYRLWHEQQNFNTKTISTLYSDSINDLPLLSHVNHAIAVDPDTALAKVAYYNKWPTVSFINKK